MTISHHRHTNTVAAIALALVLGVSTPALACSPSMDWINKPMALKLEDNEFFVGQVSAINENTFTFKIVIPSTTGPSAGKKPGETIDFPRDYYHTTCAELPLKIGDIWLFDGDTLSTGPSAKLEPADMSNTTDLATIKQRVLARLDPAYVPPRAPAKEDLPVPGTYTRVQECGPADKEQGRANSTYTLTIAAPAAASNLYTLTINSTPCNNIPTCTYTAQAPAYGYGEIVIPVTNDKGRNCSLLIQQLSGAKDWPRLKTGQTRVQWNDYACDGIIPTCSGHIIEAPLLDKK